MLSDLTPSIINTNIPLIASSPFSLIIIKRPNPCPYTNTPLNLSRLQPVVNRNMQNNTYMILEIELTYKANNVTPYPLIGNGGPVRFTNNYPLTTNNTNVLGLDLGINRPVSFLNVIDNFTNWGNKISESGYDLFTEQDIIYLLEKARTREVALILIAPSIMTREEIQCLMLLLKIIPNLYKRLTLYYFIYSYRLNWIQSVFRRWNWISKSSTRSNPK